MTDESRTVLLEFLNELSQEHIMPDAMKDALVAKLEPFFDDIEFRMGELIRQNQILQQRVIDDDANTAPTPIGDEGPGETGIVQPGDESDGSGQDGNRSSDGSDRTSIPATSGTGTEAQSSQE